MIDLPDIEEARSWIAAIPDIMLAIFASMESITCAFMLIVAYLLRWIGVSPKLITPAVLVGLGPGFYFYVSQRGGVWAKIQLPLDLWLKKAIIAFALPIVVYAFHAIVLSRWLDPKVFKGNQSSEDENTAFWPKPKHHEKPNDPPDSHP